MKNRLKVIIIEKGYSNVKIAKMIGVSEQTITNWCSEERAPVALEKFSELCTILEIHPKEIFPNIKKKKV